MVHQEFAHVVLIMLFPAFFVIVTMLSAVCCQKYLIHTTVLMVALVLCIFIGYLFLPTVTIVVMFASAIMFSLVTVVFTFLPIFAWGIALYTIFGPDNAVLPRFYALLCIHVLMYVRTFVVMMLVEAEKTYQITFIKTTAMLSCLAALSVFCRCKKITSAIILQTSFVASMELLSIYLVSTSRSFDEQWPSFVLSVSLFGIRLAVMHPLYRKSDAKKND